MKKEKKKNQHYDLVWDKTKLRGKNTHISESLGIFNHAKIWCVDLTWARKGVMFYIFKERSSQKVNLEFFEISKMWQSIIPEKLNRHLVWVYDPVD